MLITIHESSSITETLCAEGKWELATLYVCHLGANKQNGNILTIFEVQVGSI